MSGGPDWLRERLFERRIVLLTGPLDHALATQVVAQLTALDATGPEPMALHVDSADGAVEAGLAVLDAIDGLRTAVHALCRGQVGTPALAAVAASAHRAATPHARFRLAQPRASFVGRPDDLAARSHAQQEALWRLYARLARVTRRPAEEIAEDIRRGRIMDAEEARAYGLVDAVVAARD